MKLTNYIKILFLKKTFCPINSFSNNLSFRQFAFSSSNVLEDERTLKIARGILFSYQTVLIDYDYHRIIFDEIARRKIAKIASVSTRDQSWLS